MKYTRTVFLAAASMAHFACAETKEAMDYPRPDEDYDGSQPWVMWKDTPYEHLMLPVK